MLGINRVLWGGVFPNVEQANRPETIARYGYGTPDDWLERNLHSRCQTLGLTLVGIVDVILSGIVPGGLVLLARIVWIPFWAAGVINGVGRTLEQGVRVRHWLALHPPARR